MATPLPVARVPVARVPVAMAAMGTRDARVKAAWRPLEAKAEWEAREAPRREPNATRPPTVFFTPIAVPAKRCPWDSDVHRCRFARQEHGIRTGSSVHDPHTRSSPGTVVAIDDAERYVDIKRGKKSEVPHPAALIPFENVNDVVLRESIAHVAEHVIEHGFGEGLAYRALSALLLREAPRVGQTHGAALVDAKNDVVVEARRLATKLDRTVLPVQGPPGSGKTYIGAHMILELLARGKKVGVTATSHKVVGNLLEAVCREGDKLGVSVSGIQKANAHQRCEASAIEATDDNAAVHDALASNDVRLAGGVPWLWARAEMRGSVSRACTHPARTSPGSLLGNAPRGMEFLYSANRLNVATSRARCLAVIVASPALFSPRCRTPEQMRLANGLCAFSEGAGTVPGSKT